ncbi:MAG: hypothetical protein HC763_29780 [Hydrococcus sp. CRU_1_1]|jgi:hypothetical protein|nr:hypothetical protein [Hydrococcus sp. CRU_1_1]
MLITNDYAFHQRTGMVGKVIGYGHKVVNNSSFQTLKVLVCEQNQLGKKRFVIEDLASRWMPMK